MADFSPSQSASLGFTELMGRAFDPMELTVRNANPTVTRFSARGGSFFRGTRVRLDHEGSIIGQRSWRMIRQRSQDQFYLVAVTSGEVVHHQFDRMTVTGPGQMVLLDSSAPYEFERRIPAEVLSFHLPGSVVREAIDCPQDICVVGFDTTQGIGNIIASLCDSAWREMCALEESENLIVVSNVISLVDAACRHRGRMANRSNSSFGLFPRALRYMEEHLNDPELGPTQIAGAIGISVSHFYSILRKHGTTSGALVTEMRLERCAQDLRSIDFGAMRISEVGFRWGFNDAAHFSRSFRSRFGRSPTEFRRDELSRNPSG